MTPVGPYRREVERYVEAFFNKLTHRNNGCQHHSATISLEMSKRTALITGCSPGGIGYFLAKEFHARGLHVVATARNLSSIAELKEMGMTTLSLEVTNSESILEAKKAVSELTGGKLDILINNAGRNYTVPAAEVDMPEVRQVFETNFHAVVLITQTFLPLLLTSKGLIVNIGSISGILPYVFGGIYNASKAALHSYSSALRLELEPFDVKVMVVVTGGVKSNVARVDRTLRPDSLYLQIEGDYLRRVKHSQEVGTDTVKYAREVVGEVLKPRPKPWIWKGNFAVVVWFLTHLPLAAGFWMSEVVFRRMFGLNKLGKMID